jgi:hypothetical protein
MRFVFTPPGALWMKLMEGFAAAKWVMDKDVMVTA